VFDVRCFGGRLGARFGHPGERPSAHTFGEVAVILTEGVRGRHSDRRCAWPILAEGVRGRHSGRRRAWPILAEGMMGAWVLGDGLGRQTLT
jgi:hypothetical protein